MKLLVMGHFHSCRIGIPAFRIRTSYHKLYILGHYRGRLRWRGRCVREHAWGCMYPCSVCYCTDFIKVSEGQTLKRGRRFCNGPGHDGVIRPGSASSRQKAFLARWANHGPGSKRAARGIEEMRAQPRRHVLRTHAGLFLTNRRPPPPRHRLLDLRKAGLAPTIFGPLLSSSADSPLLPTTLPLPPASPSVRNSPPRLH